MNTTTTTTLAIPSSSHVLNATTKAIVKVTTTTFPSKLTTNITETVKPVLSFSSSTSTSTIAITTSSLETYDSGYMESRIIFLFCTVLLIVATMLIIKIVTSNKRKKRASFSGITDRWRISTSRSSAQTGRVQGVGLMSGSAIYTAMPSNANTLDLANPQARLDWERQFFDEENVQGNPLEDDSYTSSRLQLNLS